MAFSNSNIQRELLKDNKKPYTHCSDCQESLLNKLHHVEQFYGRLSLDEDLKLIFGYAICGDCRDRLAKKISIKTLQNIDELKNSYTKLNDYTRIQLEYALNKEVLPPIKNCTFTGTPIHQMKEYQVSAVIFHKNQASEAIVYGEVFIKDFEQCLSEDTKDELDDFFNRIVDLPPSLKDLFDERVLVI